MKNLPQDNFWKILIGIYCVICTTAFALLCRLWGEDACTFGDNIQVEIIAGSFMSIIPLFFGVFIGRKMKQRKFYDDIEEFIEIVKKQRLKKTIDKEDTRNLIVEFTKTVKTDILQEPWYEEIRKKEFKQNLECGICGLKTEVKKNKCTHCKLNYAAWANFEKQQPEEENV